MYYDFNGKILKRKVVVLELDKSFDYTSDEQIYISKLDGYYKLEVWGAQGGSYNSYVGGYGGYSTGVVYLNAGTWLYINVGGYGNDACNKQYCEGGFNGEVEVLEAIIQFIPLEVVVQHILLLLLDY